MRRKGDCRAAGTAEWFYRAPRPANRYSTSIQHQLPARVTKIPQHSFHDAVPRDECRLVRAIIAAPQSASHHRTRHPPSFFLRHAHRAQTHITSKYTVLKPNARKIKKHTKYLEKRAARPADSSRPATESNAADSALEPKATFVLKTYDPTSGTCLQYQTTKAAEVGRLISSLGRLGRHQAALPEGMEDAGATGEATGVSTPQVEEDLKMGGMPAEAKAGGGGKKKKKGKK